MNKMTVMNLHLWINIKKIQNPFNTTNKTGIHICKKLITKQVPEVTYLI